MRIVSHEGIMSGVPIIEGTRLPVYMIVFKATGFAEEIAKDFPGIDKQQVLDALNFASEYMMRLRLSSRGVRMGYRDLDALNFSVE